MQINNLVVFSSTMMRKMTAITYSLRTRQLRTSALIISSTFSSILRKTKHRLGRRLWPLRRDSQLISPWVREETLLHPACLPADLIKFPMPAYSAEVPTIALLPKGLLRMHIFLLVAVVTMTKRRTAVCSSRTLALRSMTHK